MKKNLFSFVLLVLLIPLVSGQNIDIGLLRDININRNAALDPTFRFMSNSVAPVVMLTPVIAYGVGMLKKDPVLKREAICIGATVFVSVVISNALKYSINRERPFDKYPDIDDAMDVHSPSFPSGHTSQSFSLATSLSLMVPRWYVIIPSYLWAGTVAYSRMHLGVHYPSDVLAGALIGSGSAFLCFKINQKLAHLQGRPNL
jgi:membrane-associated phospholipid phosphatase